jgi:hypothetical protein
MKLKQKRIGRERVKIEKLFLIGPAYFALKQVGICFPFLSYNGSKIDKILYFIHLL